MFCPECGSEYVRDLESCPRCHVALTAEDADDARDLLGGLSSAESSELQCAPETDAADPPPSPSRWSRARQAGRLVAAVILAFFLLEFLYAVLAALNFI